MGWLLGIPSKIILLNPYVDNHFISPNTVRALQEYLVRNDLTNVKVRVNQYAPLREWSRLFRNKSVGWGWRYTFGTLSLLVYTVLPGRLFGGDNYNPYTNTLNLYSDHPAIALHEGGHAKDFAPRKYKGTYAFFYMLPFFALYPEARATSDVLSYLHEQPSVTDEAAAYRILYPAYATYVGGEMTQHVQPVSSVYWGALIAGHLLGQWKGYQALGRRPARHHISVADLSQSE